MNTALLFGVLIHFAIYIYIYTQYLETASFRICLCMYNL
jgi:hypothetical protein